jgi:hypothetical protein
VPTSAAGGFFFDCFDFRLFEGPEYYAGGALVLGAIGAGVGALVAPGEKWEAVSSDRLGLAVGSTRGGGLKLGVSFRF